MVSASRNTGFRHNALTCHNRRIRAKRPNVAWRQQCERPNVVWRQHCVPLGGPLGSIFDVKATEWAAVGLQRPLLLRAEPEQGQTAVDGGTRDIGFGCGSACAPKQSGTAQPSSCMPVVAQVAWIMVSVSRPATLSQKPMRASSHSSVSGCH